MRTIPKSETSYFPKGLRWEGGKRGGLPWQGQHVICVYEDVDLSKVGVHDMSFCLKDVLSKCEPHIETTLVRH
jgi:hypothetical protein